MLQTCLGDYSSVKSWNYFSQDFFKKKWLQLRVLLRFCIHMFIFLYYNDYRKNILLLIIWGRNSPIFHIKKKIVLHNLKIFYPKKISQMTCHSSLN